MLGVSVELGEAIAHNFPSSSAVSPPSSASALHRSHFLLIDLSAHTLGRLESALLACLEKLFIVRPSGPTVI